MTSSCCTTSTASSTPGGAGRLLSAHLLGTLDHEQVATFDMDALIDYRSRRPTMTFVKDHWESYEAPELAIYLMHDATGAPFLLLNGPSRTTCGRASPARSAPCR